jgi:predicted transcriptional regulator
MTRKILKEGRVLADLTYDIEQIEIKEAKIQSKLLFHQNIDGTTTINNKNMLEEFISLCKIRMTLLAKKDYQKQSLYSFSFTSKYNTVVICFPSVCVSPLIIYINIFT